METTTTTTTEEDSFGTEVAKAVVATVAVTAAMYGTMIAAGYVAYKIDKRRERKELEAKIIKDLEDTLKKAAELQN